MTFHHHQAVAAPVLADEPEQEDELYGDGDELDLGDGAAAPRPVPKQKARALVASSRRKALHTMHFAAHVISRPLSRRLYFGQCKLSKPLREAFMEEMEALKTRRGSRALHLDLVAGEGRETIRNLFNRWCSEAFAKSIEFGRRHASDLKFREDFKVASTMWRVTIGCAGATILTDCAYTALPPLVFLKLVDPRESLVAEGLRFCKQLWDGLTALEAAAIGRKDIENFCISLRWPCEQWCRRILLMLAEDDFQFVRPAMLQEVEAFLNAPKTTLFVEHFNNLGRRVERRNGSGKLEPIAAWHRFSCCKILEEHDIRKVSATAASDAAAPSVIDASIFESTELDSHIPDELLETMAMGTPNWPTQNALNRKLASMRTLCLIETGGAWERIQASFWSAVARPGLVVFTQGDPTAVLCLVSGRFGLLGWNVELARNAAGVYLRFGKKTDKSIAYHRIEEPENWQCVAVRAVAPGDQDLDPAWTLPGLRAMLVGEKQDLLRNGAEHGFPGLLRDDLRRMFDHLKIPYVRGKKPSSKGDLLMAVIKHCLGCTDQQAQEAMEKHDQEEFEDIDPGSATIFDPDVLQGLLEEMGDEGFEEAIVSFKGEYEGRKAARCWRDLHRQKAAPAAPAASAGSSSSGSAGAAIAWPPGRSLTQREAKRYVPPGTNVRKDTGWNLAPRWQFRAKWLDSSLSASYPHGDHEADRNAFVQVLRKAWAERTRDFDEVCPWDLGPLGF